MNQPLQILYRDRDLVAVDKPAGLLIHASSISRDTRFLVQTLRDQIGQRVWPVHRLDRATSGVVVMALSSEVASVLGRAFQERRVRKFYLALVRGWVEERGVLNRPLANLEGAGKQQASTRFRTLGRIELPVAVSRYPTSRYSLIMVQPETGRMHQIRRHLKQAFHPIIGDTTYGEGRHNRFFRSHYGIHRLLLHARSLVVPHPSGRPLKLMAPLPAAFSTLAACWCASPFSSQTEE